MKCVSFCTNPSWDVGSASPYWTTVLSLLRTQLWTQYLISFSLYFQVLTLSRDSLHDSEIIIIAPLTNGVFGACCSFFQAKRDTHFEPWIWRSRKAEVSIHAWSVTKDRSDAVRANRRPRMCLWFLSEPEHWCNCHCLHTGKGGHRNYAKSLFFFICFLVSLKMSLGKLGYKKAAHIQMEDTEVWCCLLATVWVMDNLFILLFVVSCEMIQTQYLNR